jgi:hypothetical protein
MRVTLREPAEKPSTHFMTKKGVQLYVKCTYSVTFFHTFLLCFVVVTLEVCEYNRENDKVWNKNRGWVFDCKQERKKPTNKETYNRNSFIVQ